MMREIPREAEEIIYQIIGYVSVMKDHKGLKRLAERLEKLMNPNCTNPGLTIIGVKVVGICSKCRKEGDEIPKNKDGSIVPDKKISCVNTAFANCTLSESEKEE